LEKKLVPYNLYIYSDQATELRKLAQSRKASALIRDAIDMVLQGQKPYDAGYNRAILDVIKALKDIPELQILAIHGKPLDKVIRQALVELKK
jgi:hypothetical protein